MGRGKRVIPERLPEKLKAIRATGDNTLEEMVVKLEAKLTELKYADIKIYSGNVYEFEKGSREPLLPILLAYALIGKISLDSLVDDRLDLPDKNSRKI